MKLFLFFVLSFTTLFSLDFDYLITTQKLKKEVYKKFPLKKDTLVTKLVLSEPHIELQENRVLLNSLITLPQILDTNNKPMQARISLASAIRFKAPNQLYLKDIEILDIQNSYIQEEQKKVLLFSLTIALNTYFRKNVAYTLEYERIKDDLAKMAASHLKNINISQKGITLRFKL